MEGKPINKRSFYTYKEPVTNTRTSNTLAYMDRNFYDNDDFEMFLKQKSDQYKMYPSDRVWNNIYSSIHGRKKWWALGFTIFFISAGLLGGKQLLLSHYSKMATQLNTDTNNETLSSLNSVLPSAKPGIVRNMPVSFIKNEATLNGFTKPAQQQLNPAINDNNVNTAKSFIVAIFDNKLTNKAPLITTAETSQLMQNDLQSSSIAAIPANEVRAISVSIPISKIALRETVSSEDNSAQQKTYSLIDQSENAVTSLTKPSRWSLQFYASPTISYRRLSAVNQDNNNSVPVATGYATNINQYVNHKPATGFELGSNVQYKLSDNLSLFVGAQLNYSRYYISAYKYRTEKASIALNSPVAHDTLSGYTDIRNLSGYAPEQLQNKYLQLSIPVGMEIKILGNKKLQFSIAGGIQPTFLLNSTSYLISTDYKNYIQSPDLARSFNVHTNFEAFVSYNAGGLKWQIGPQFRSQLLSSYSNQYRVREYLTEYGIKFGVSKSF